MERQLNPEGSLHLRVEFVDACPVCQANVVIEFHPGTTGDTWSVRQKCEHFIPTGGMNQWEGGECVWGGHKAVRDPGCWRAPAVT